MLFLTIVITASVMWLMERTEDNNDLDGSTVSELKIKISEQSKIIIELEDKLKDCKKKNKKLRRLR